MGCGGPCPHIYRKSCYKKHENDEDVVYCWDLGNARYGSFEIDGERTSIDRYQIDFSTWEQRNLDNNRRRSVRLVWVPTERVDPIWIGEIPNTGEKKESCSVEQPASNS